MYVIVKKTWFCLINIVHFVAILNMFKQIFFDLVSFINCSNSITNSALSQQFSVSLLVL